MAVASENLLPSLDDCFCFVRLEIKEGGGGGGGGDLQYSTYPCRNPYKVNFSLHKRRYFGRVFEASEGKCEASEEHRTPLRLSQPVM